MRISSLQEYGLRCILQVASHKSDSPLTVRDIAKNEALSLVYVAKILVALRKAGLVQSVRGVRGGYRLSRPAAEVSAGQVLGALGRIDTTKNHCGRFPGTQAACTHIQNCGIRPVLSVLIEHIYSFLNQLNLEQLAKDEAAVTRDVMLVRERMAAPNLGGLP